MLKDILENNNLTHMIRSPKVCKMLPKNSHEVRIQVVNAINQHKKIKVYPDCDLDGVHSAACWDYTFKRLNYTNYTVNKLTKRTHSLSLLNIEQDLRDGVEVFIIVDSSSSDMMLINTIVNYNANTQVIIIDHHNCNFNFESYPKRCTIVNPRMEDKNVPYYECSAGYLNALITSYLLAGYQIVDTGELDLLGYATMYSDICDCSHPFIVGSMVKCFNAVTHIPKQMLLFLNKYTSINKNFICWTYSPVVTALCKMNRFDLIDRLFFHLEKEADVDALVKEILDVRKKARETVAEILNNHITTTSLGNNNALIWITMESGLPEHYYNFQGSIANSLAKEYNCAAVCVNYEANTGQYRGSARDAKNRDLLAEFSTYFEDSAGHDSAFGVKIDEERVKLLPTIINSAKQSTKENSLIVNYGELINDAEILTIARYNEFVITNIPIIKMKIFVGGEFQIRNGAKKSVAETKSVIIEAIGKPINRNEEVICIPQYNGHKVVCMVD